jgi:site-specific DNA-methyltransferase (adenine-specific)
VSGRESHDASGFYARFAPPDISGADVVLVPEPVAEPFVCGDARSMSSVADGSVALVVTSPPYFAGKQYEEELAREGVPSSYLEYLAMLGGVLRECVRTLEPGGRIAVNVANLGRKPYRSLSADVIRILQDDLGLLLRGELIWQKAEGASGSCAWGSYRSAANPVLRDVTERVVIASKGRFDRARTVAQRAAAGLPHRSTLPTDDFLALTLDVWSLPSESARRVGHPAPFPVELPEQLIRLLTYEDDLVLDPFMGSGSTLVAAARLGRRYVGYDLDPSYVAIARERVAEARSQEEGAGTTPSPLRERARAEGRGARDLAADALVEAGFTITGRDVRVRGTGVVVPFAASDATGRAWLFDVPGPFTSHRGGLVRTEAVWRALGRAVAVRGAATGVPLVLLASDLPRRGSEGDKGLRAAGPGVVRDVVDLLDAGARARLAGYAAGAPAPAPGYWSESDLDVDGAGPGEPVPGPSAG